MSRNFQDEVTASTLSLFAMMPSSYVLAGRRRILLLSVKSAPAQSTIVIEEKVKLARYQTEVSKGRTTGDFSCLPHVGQVLRPFFPVLGAEPEGHRFDGRDVNLTRELNCFEWLSGNYNGQTSEQSVFGGVKSHPLSRLRPVPPS